ncbi:MAG: phosphoribosylamine--glycine ligase [Ilumatobacter sp.]|uniref:phosphoribosylamine--glycine ligase n=1 Tax=Ilumatobacter sp. TaxID=1967498 RepID=UPI00262E6C2A|nr:phosphoribosylamine--glycine ligase [Ilumatobacter sp.]MDJ0771772.1 phosphoribosylamine--glycine ligase [Ilumatobacter sp.]
MRVLVIGSGGREHAIAWACERHGHTVTMAPELGEVTTDDVDLVIPGPESALVAGVADECSFRKIPCLGPTSKQARIESSKGYSRHLATSLGVPGPRYERFEEMDADSGVAWASEFGAPVVVKFDGLAAGKGVVVPTTAAETEAAIRATAALGPYMLEEQLSGPECSLLALCDGTTAVALPLAQDHKRIGEGDTGPNTGGMGAYAPAPVPYDADELLRTFVLPIVDYFAAAGTPYVGVLYAGLMLTAEGPRLIEYNCRFGDPETQAVLPLLESDLAELALACTRHAVGDEEIKVRPGAACTVVAASPGYPDDPHTGAPIHLDGFSTTDWANQSTNVPEATLFPAGVDDGRTAGGRVLAVTGLGDDLAAARSAAYRALDGVSFPNMQVRRDIGWRAPGALLTSYASAGVDIDEGNRAVERMRGAVERTLGADVLKGVGSFGGVLSARRILELGDPVLVASTDGVGTKVELAARLGKVRGVGADIVNHCIDDVLVQSARPFFFLDYIAASALDADLVAEVVTGMADACEAAGCVLLGGETAEMPGVYQEGAFDIAGTLVGVAERSELLPRDDVAAGDVLIGVASSGPHTNGYSFLRKLFDWVPMDVTPPGFEVPLGDALLEPHRSYLGVLDAALATGAVKALAHITGGGLPENLPRVLPDGVDAEIELGSWPRSALFDLITELATGVDTHELHRMLNMGIGMVVVCAADEVDTVQAAIPEPTWVIGALVRGDAGGRTVHLL